MKTQNLPPKANKPKKKKLKIETAPVEVTTLISTTREYSRRTVTFQQCEDPQDLCVEFSQRNDHIPVWASDFFEAKKLYTAVSYRSMTDRIKEAWKSGNPSHYYEIVLPYLPCHVFIDMDADLTIDGNTLEKMQEIHKDFVKFFSLYLVECGYAKRKSEIKFYITDSSNKEKWSKHYVVKVDNGVFQNAYHVGSLVRHFLNWMLVHDDALEDNSKCRFYIKTFEQKKKRQGLVCEPVIDKLVYTDRRVFRPPYNNKLKKTDEKRSFLPSHCTGDSPEEVKIVDHNKFLDEYKILDWFVQFDIKRERTLTCYTIWGTEPYSTNVRDFELITKQPPSFLKMTVPRKKYMHEEFPLEQIWKRFGGPNREWMKDIANPTENKKKKWSCARPFYSSFQEFKRDMLDEKQNIVGVHIGGEFSEQRNTSKLLKKEFVLDCDIPDWKDENGLSLRKCGCSDSMCLDCSLIMVLTFRVVMFMLSKDYLGFGKTEAYFSGSKGIHFWIDPDDQELKKIVKPVQRSRFILLLSYQNWLAEDMLKKDKKIAETVKKISESDYLHSNKTSPPIDVLKNFWPRFDSDVTVNESGKRMARCPLSLHTKSNRKVERIYDPESFFEQTFKGLN